MYALAPSAWKPTFDGLACTARRYTFLYLAILLFLINEFERLVGYFFSTSRLWTLQPMYRLFITSMSAFLITIWLYIYNIDSIQYELTTNLRSLLSKIRGLDLRDPKQKIEVDDLHCDDELCDVVQALNIKSTQIQHHVEHLEQLIWYVQHEFNTPLAIAHIHIDRLEKTVGEDDPAVLWIKEELDHMRLLVEAIVSLIQTKSETHTSEEFLVYPMISKIADHLGALHENVQIHLDIDPDYAIHWYKQYVRAICRNICENAIKHGWDEIHIWAGPWYLTIKDNWSWIDQTTLEKMRLPFWKKNPRSWKKVWFWLWLSLVQVLLEKMNRRVDVTSSDIWTTFSFTY